MARKKPSSRARTPAKKTTKTNEDKVEAATAVEESSDIPVEADAEDSAADAKPSSEQAAADAKAETDTTTSDAVDADKEEAEAASEKGDGATSADDTPEEDAAPTNEDPEPISHTPPPVAAEQVIIRKGGFVPLVLGGLVAAAIGFGVAQYGLLEDGPTLADVQASTTKALDDQSAKLTGLSDRIDGLSEDPDLSGIENAQADLDAAVNSLSDRINAIETQLSDLNAKLTDLATRPLTEGASEAAVAAYEAELKKLQDAMAAQRAEIEAMATDARAMEDNAQETAEATIRRAAVTRIQAALENGSGFAPALADLEATGISAPDALTRVAHSGVASLADLQDSFPDAARTALATSRDAAGIEGESGGFSAFLRNQLGARSLEPRAGNDPDAVLSRAEAAVRDGRLTDALAEIEALPEVGRAELSDWSGDVAQRLEALAAAQTLSENMN